MSVQEKEEAIVKDAAGSDIEEDEMNGDSSKAAPSEVVIPADETDDEKKNRACRQIEFYFSDSNLPYDKFMWTLHTSNDEHWVPIKTVSSFKRMREFQPLGPEWLLSALRTSADLEVDEEGTKVRRKTEVTEPKGQFERSIYAKGFGKEEPGLQQKLEKFFNQYGRFNAVRMRRNNETREFKGSVFVEYSDLSSAERFLKADPKPTWNGEELLTMSKEAYCQMKVKEKGLKGKAAQFRRERESGNGLRQGFNAFRQMKGDDKKEPAKKPEVILDFMGSKLTVIDEDGGRVDEDKVPYVKNSALKLSGIEGELAFDDIKKPMKERFEYAPFIKYEKGASEGLVGFSKALTDEDVSFVKETIKTLNGKEVSWAAAEESEEKAFLIERAQNAARRVMTIATRNSGRGGKPARGGRGASRGGGRGRGRGGARGGAQAQGRLEKSGKDESEAQPGEKRKRAVEPDGAADTGIRGQAVPKIQSAAKKVKTEETPVAAAS